MQFKQYTICDNNKKIKPDEVKSLLDGSYWAPDRPLDVIMRTMQHSICIGAFDGTKLVGFARVVTDRAVFAWIADIVVHPDHRGVGLATCMLRFIQEHPDIPSRLQVLRTRDAHSLYEKFGFRSDGSFMFKKN